MVNISKLLHMAVNVIIFFIAITVLYLFYRRTISLVDVSAANVADDIMLYESYQPDTTHYTSRAELTALLMGKLEYDLDVVNVDGTYSIIAQGYKPEDLGLYPVMSNYYEKSYFYNLNGTITKIKYQYVLD